MIRTSIIPQLQRQVRFFNSNQKKDPKKASSFSRDKKTTSSKTSTAIGGDPRYTMMKEILFDVPPPQPKELEAEDVEMVQVIDRAWKVYQHQLEYKKTQALNKQFWKMREAMEELKKVDQRLFEKAQYQGQPLYFPIQMRGLTDIPPKNEWGVAKEK
jgi:hypothetical protein